MSDEHSDWQGLLPDPARDSLPAHRHHALREQFMAQLGDNRTEPAARRWMPALVGGFVAVLVIVGVTVAVLQRAGGPSTTQPVVFPGNVPPSPTVTITGGPRYDGEGTPEQPPPFRVRYDDTELLLYPQTYCWSSGCVDGVLDEGPDVGSPDELFVWVPLAQFTDLHVSQHEGGMTNYCGRSVEALVTSLGEGWWSVRPQGPAGDYTVSIFAGGNGDMIGNVRWHTPADQPLPPVEASLSLIANHDGRPDSYGLELAIANLATSPAQYSATITVTAANAASMVIEATPGEACQAVGSLWFNGPADQAAQAAALGDFPFTYEVELVLDGVTHVATATYPDDETPGAEPAVALEFTPPLR